MSHDSRRIKSEMQSPIHNTQIIQTELTEIESSLYLINPWPVVITFLSTSFAIDLHKFGRHGVGPSSSFRKRRQEKRQFHRQINPHTLHWHLQK